MRIILTSVRVRDAVIAVVAGVLLALAFPKTNAAWLAPLGAATLFWLWRGASWKRAFWLGWLAGTVFFAISFDWFGTTVDAYVGVFAPLVGIIPALLEGVYVGAAGALTVLAVRRAPAWAWPLAGAAIFTVAEWLRSIGPMGLPFAQLGYSQADSPLAPVAAYAGTYGVTFAICVLGAYLAETVARRTTRPFAVALLVVAAVTTCCWLAWPARRAAAPAMRVAAVQGNIAQSLKWTHAAVVEAIARYTQQTQALAPSHPQLVVWPETVIAEELNRDPATEARFASLARSLHTTLVVGAQRQQGAAFFNSLYIFGPDGTLQDVYDKRQLVPIVEGMPFGDLFAWVPYVKQLGGGEMSPGNVDGVYPTSGLRFAPLICWESAFSDVAHAQLRDGAQLLVVATDDAWFGTSAGPYMHAQIAQLRAIEAGTWVVRAAATGVSGIISPTGRWTAQSALETQTTIFGLVGTPPGSIFARVGPTPVMLTIAVLYIVLLVLPRKETR